jgi:serine/threonine protein kinase
MSMHLFVTAGADKDRSFPLAETDTLTIGSSHKNAEICLHDMKVARTHCELQVDGKNVTLTDLDSESGTFVNGTRITAQQQLRPGDVIGIGGTQICLKDGDMDRRSPEAHATLEDAGYAMSASPAERIYELTGTSLAHYTVQAIVAKGHAGAVYRARDLKNNHVVAFKVLQPNFPKGDNERQAFIQAMKTMLPLRHPNLVALLATGKTGPYVWLALEHVEGESVAAMIDRIGASGQLDWRQAYRVAVHGGRALEFAHQSGVIHGNITPRNLLYRTADKTVLLNDLILMQALKGSQLKQSIWQAKMTAELPYLSPEQTQGSSNADVRTDLYCLAAVVYALLTGKPPCVAKTPQDTVKRIRNREPAPPKEFQQSMPDPFEKAVLKLLAKKPEERYQTAAEVVADLERVGRNLGMRM